MSPLSSVCWAARLPCWARVLPNKPPALGSGLGLSRGLASSSLAMAGPPSLNPSDGRFTGPSRLGAVSSDNFPTLELTHGGSKRASSGRLQPGDTLAPKDFNQRHQAKAGPRRAVVPLQDIFKERGVNPLSEYKNPSVLCHFMNESGMIKARRETGLSWGNQKKLTKAIKRARAFGILPFNYKLVPSDPRNF